MLYFATLISIPNDLFEAAYVDGATDWQIFWRIKLPLLMPMIGIVSLLTYIGNFNAFDVIFALKGADAGPNYASDTMMTFFYRTFFGSGFQKADPHMGAAVARDDVCHSPGRAFCFTSSSAGGSALTSFEAGRNGKDC